MNRKVLTTATFLVTAGFFYHSNSSEAALKIQPDLSGIVKMPPKELSVNGDVTPRAKGPWTPVCDYFALESGHSTAGTALRPSGDLRSQFCLDSEPGVHSQRAVLIATVPDPELTHLSLSFDRYVESITWALADGDLNKQRYSFSNYWLPWRADLKDATSSEQRKLAEEDREKRVSMPGLLLFRGRNEPHKLLLVFLVGETPTAGINRIAFNTARQYAAVLGNSNLSICATSACSAVLGPVFTGSIPSLKLLLESEPDLAQQETYVVSGTVTGAQPAALTTSGTHFCRTIESGDNTQNALLEYLRGRSPLDADPSSSFAYLIEDETDYGETLKTNKDSLVLRYPRGIARIRNSAQELPGLTEKPSQNTLYPELPLNLRDTGQDSIPSFSVQQSPVSQEAVLIDLVHTLRREHMKYVAIIATDPLDALFLSRVVRALDPDVRIVLFHTDLLFERAAQTWGLRGVLAVTSYPLFSRTQYYAGAHPPRRSQFASDSAEGEYNACRRMLLQRGATHPRREPGPEPACDSDMEQTSGERGDYLLDYSAPFAEATVHAVHKPSAWLMILGHDSWWPVAALPSNGKSVVLNGPNPAAHNKEHFSAETAPQLWFLFFWLMLSACAAHVLLLFCVNSNLSYFRLLWKRAPIRVLGWGYKPELQSRRRAMLAAATLAVGTVCFVLVAAAYTSGLAAENGNTELSAAIGVGLLAIVEALWVARTTNAFWPVIACMIVEAAVALLASRTGATGHALAFAGYRAVHLESGASPLLPPILLLSALYLYFWFRLSQLRTVEDRSTPLPPAKELRLVADRARIARASTDKLKYGGVGAGVLCWLVFLNPFRALGGIEGTVYALTMTILSSVVVGLLVLTTLRFVSGWRSVRKLLEGLERHPNRYAFSRLPKDFSWTAVWTGDSRPKLLMPMRSLDVLRMIPEGQPNVQTVEEQLQFLSNPARSFESSYQHGEALHAALNEAATVIAEKMRPIWDAGISDAIASREKREELPPEWAKDPIQIARQEFIALRYVAFIRYALLQLRAFLEFATYGFILLVAALTVYPFDGRRKIGIAVVTLFLVIGACSVGVFAQMDRDPLLSRLSETKPNELDRNFVYRLLSFGALPLLTLLASQVPEIGNFLLSWAQPALQAMK